ncbi:hypothetical protein PInf_017637 [Phytophthora infestans]|nr:hypothetical protein PInf_017637 [Phytophthora infestans]
MGREQRDRDDKLRERSTDPKDQTEIRSMKIRPIGRPRAWLCRGPTKYGNVIVGLGFIEHVSRTDDQLHNSKDNFYRFTKVLEYDDSAESFASDTATRRRAIALATEEALNVLAKVLHKVFERKNKLLFYKGFIACIVDAEAVNVIRIAITHIDAVLIGQVLLDEGLIEPIATAVFTCTVFSTEQLAEV